MYLFNNFNIDIFFKNLQELNKKSIKFILSYNGKRGSNDININIPDFYIHHLYIKSGNSSFNKLKNKNIDVFDSLYLNY